MIVKKITYTDFNGKEQTEEHCFHLNKLERMRFDAKYPNGVVAWATEQEKTGIAASLLAAIEELVQTAHGVRSEDGSRFIKNAQITQEFVASPAYAELISGLFEGGTEENPAAAFEEFANGIIGQPHA